MINLRRIPGIAILGALVFSALPGFGVDFSPPVESSEEYRHFLARVPAPRGLIVDREGRPLAYSQSAKRVVVNLVQLDEVSGFEEAYERIAKVCAVMKEASIPIRMPSRSSVESHWNHRRFLPLALSDALPDAAVRMFRSMDTKTGAVELQDLYTRLYPAGPSVSHLVGYIGKRFPEQYGEWGRNEYLWPPSEGRNGIEKSMETALRGTDGLMSLLYDKNGREVFREMLRNPVPGKTVVLSVNLDMQRLGLELLEGSKHNGAFVAMDSETGDLLSLVSNPGYDPNEFVPEITTERYLELTADPRSPFYYRAVGGQYPPGSTFKTLVGVAALTSPYVMPTTQFSGPPAMDVDGLIFRNWNSNHEGMFDLKYALVRSCNTWFYQASFETGDRRIIEVAENFGIGSAPDIPLDGVAAGFMPPKFPDRRGLANISIGQGQLLVSPLQMAVAMSGFANRDRIALPRLVLQLQDPLTAEPVEVTPPRFRSISADETYVEVVREGMWGVVNHGGGTAGRARLSNMHVYGKTGTAQWMNGGEERRLAWFTGFADTSRPKIAFAVLTEGASGESMSGGSNSAPLAAGFLKQIYQEPENYYVAAATDLPDYRPMIQGPTRVEETFTVEEDPRFFLFGRPFNRDRADRPDRPRRGGIFSGLFGGRNR